MKHRRMNVQDQFLNACRKQKVQLNLYLKEGMPLTGIITAYDTFNLIMDIKGQQHFIYKHAISTLSLTHPLEIPRPVNSLVDNQQDMFMSQAILRKIQLKIFTTNGKALDGVMSHHDTFVIVLEHKGRQSMVYKHAISTIVPKKPISLKVNLDDVEDEKTVS